MACSESDFWRILRTGMGDTWHATRHEDACASGVPDVSYACRGTSGFIELKQLDAWPKRATTSVRIHHLSPEQTLWLRLRCKHGLAFLFVRVSRCDYLIMWGADAYDVRVTPRTRDEMEELALARWSGKIDFEELTQCLTNSHQSRRQRRQGHGA